MRVIKHIVGTRRIKIAYYTCKKKDERNKINGVITVKIGKWKLEYSQEKQKEHH